MKNLLTGILVSVLFFGTLTGCDTTPQKKTVGQTVGGGIDTAITWTSQGIQKLLNKNK
jgi:hypothetical protein